MQTIKPLKHEDNNSCMTSTSTRPASSSSPSCRNDFEHSQTSMSWPLIAIGLLGCCSFRLSFMSCAIGSHGCLLVLHQITGLCCFSGIEIFVIACVLITALLESIGSSSGPACKCLFQTCVWWQQGLASYRDLGGLRSWSKMDLRACARFSWLRSWLFHWNIDKILDEIFSQMYWVAQNHWF